MASGRRRSPNTSTATRPASRTSWCRKHLDGAGKKQFPQHHLEGGQWILGKPAGPKMPYRLQPELLAAPHGCGLFLRGRKGRRRARQSGVSCRDDGERRRRRQMAAGADGIFQGPQCRHPAQRRRAGPQARPEGRAGRSTTWRRRSRSWTCFQTAATATTSQTGSRTTSWARNCSPPSRPRPNGSRTMTSRSRPRRPRTRRCSSELAALSPLDYAKHRKRAATKARHQRRRPRPLRQRRARREEGRRDGNAS